jgi:hypothetical protein
MGGTDCDRLPEGQDYLWRSFCFIRDVLGSAKGISDTATTTGQGDLLDKVHLSHRCLAAAVWKDFACVGGSRVARTRNKVQYDANHQTVSLGTTEETPGKPFSLSKNHYIRQLLLFTNSGL